MMTIARGARASGCATARRALRQRDRARGAVGARARGDDFIATLRRRRARGDDDDGRRARTPTARLAGVIDVKRVTEVAGHGGAGGVESVRMRGVEARMWDKSYVARSSALEMDEDGLPLVYDKAQIQKYWDKQGGALQRRWGGVFKPERAVFDESGDARHHGRKRRVEQKRQSGWRRMRG
jgi:hypothetical protein